MNKTLEIATLWSDTSKLTLRVLVLLFWLPVAISNSHHGLILPQSSGTGTAPGEKACNSSPKTYSICSTSM